jgi:hypothetical protein
MQIILGQEAADALSGNYTVLELETFIKDGQEIKAFCVVTNVPVMELTELEPYKALHSMFVKEYYNGNYEFCLDAAQKLKGRFSGELDSFYDEIINRISDQEASA